MPKGTVTRREFTLALAGGAALATKQSAASGQDATSKKAGTKSPPDENSAGNAKQTKDQPTDQVEAREPPALSG